MLVFASNAPDWSPNDEAEYEELEPIPHSEKTTDPWFHARILRWMGSRTYAGYIADVEIGKVSRDRLYLIRYDDGDLEHVTEKQVLEHEEFEPIPQCEKSTDLLFHARINYGLRTGYVEDIEIGKVITDHL